MDVFFRTSKGKEFSVEIWFFDTVAEIKNKVQKNHGHPAYSQTLVFNGQILQDHRDTEYYAILQNSRIQLFLPDDFLPSKPLKLSVNIPSTNSTRQLSLEVSTGVSQRKLRIHELEQNNPPAQFALFRGSVELEDGNSLGHYDIADGSEVELVLRSGKTRVIVHINRSGRKIPVEVSGVELSELDEKLNLQLPDEYLFLHNGNVMEEDEKQGETVHIFQGTLTY